MLRKNVHSKIRKYRTARQIWVARVPGWILTTCRSLNDDAHLQTLTNVPTKS